MKFRIDRSPVTEIKTDVIAVGVANAAPSKGSPAQILDKQLDGALSQVIADEEFKGKPGSAKLLSTLGRLPSKYLLLVGLGETKKTTLETVRKAAALVYTHAKSVNAKSVASELFSAGGVRREDAAQAFAEGLFLAGYQFDEYKNEKDKNKISLQEISLLSGKKENKTALLTRLHVGEVLARAAMHARDLVNSPARDMTPRHLAEAARKVKGIQVKTLSKAEIKRLGMNAYLSVAEGSSEAPIFIEMIYTPSRSKAKKILALVGKGVTFDSGGLSIKPAKSMETMKCDMAGAAAAIAFMQVVGELEPAIEVRAYVAATENMPDGSSTRPGDIVRAMNGKTIEILNTDAEGRLTLADALHYAVTRKVKPDYVIDLATLTGACLVALGERCTAAMGTDQGLVDKLKKAGEKSGEMIWQLPLMDDYADDIKSPIADLKNVGGHYAGTINGGLFLREFVGDAKWVHLDIAGSAWTDKPLPYTPKGGTGAMVRTLWELIQLL